MTATVHHAEAQRRFRGGDLHGARALFRAALADDPGHPASHHDLGFLLRQLGDRSGADRHVRVSLALAPDLAVGWTTAGLLAGDSGAFAPARRAIGRARLIAPREPSSLIALAELADDRECRGFAERLADAARRPDLPPEMRARLLHARGRLLDRAGDPDAAIDAIAAAHALRRASRPYDRAEDSGFFAAIAAACDAAWWDRPGHPGDPGIRPIFIVGMPRSGTTLLEQMLSRHPGVTAGGETLALQTVLFAELPARLGTAFPDCLAAAGPADWAWAAERYRAATAGRVGGAAVFTDKLPGNFLLVGPILKMFPGARVLHSLRDPLDTALSCHFTDFAHGQNYAGDLGDLGHHLGLYRRLMRHWRSFGSDRLLDVGHEELVAAPERALRRALEHCGLAWDPACLDYRAAAHPANTAAWQRVRAPLDGSRAGRWRRYQHRLGRLAGALTGATPRDTARRALAWEPGLRAEAAALVQAALERGDVATARRRVARLGALLTGAPQALSRAAALADRAGDAALTRRLLAAAAAAAPGVAALHVNLAVAHGRDGDTTAAARSLRRALALLPPAPEAWSNLGNFLVAADLRPAVAAHRRATLIAPPDAGLHANHGLALMRTADGAAAAGRALRRAVALDPDGLGHGLTLAHLAVARGDAAGALAMLDRLARAHPGDKEVQYERGCALRDAGRDAEAIPALRRAVVLAPELPALRHVLDALTGRPSRAAPVDYVRDLFDEYADRFDEHLTERLRYRTPSALAAAVARARPGAGGFARALDLGCGTGLMGSALRERFAVGHLTGVDISGGMLARLREKGGYDATAETDIEGFLERADGRPGDRYDLIVAADVLVYFGALDRFMAGAAGALADRGILAISVERSTAEPVALGRQGRYAHRRDYVEATAAASGLRVLLCEEAAIRNEGSAPVIGLLLVLAV